jgi:hypothetical protein
MNTKTKVEKSALPAVSDDVGKVGQVAPLFMV